MYFLIVYIFIFIFYYKIIIIFLCILRFFNYLNRGSLNLILND